MEGEGCVVSGGREGKEVQWTRSGEGRLYVCGEDGVED